MKIQDMDEGQFLDLLKRLQVDHLEPKIKEIVKAEFEAERHNFWVPAERHYMEHAHIEKCVLSAKEREANHAFVSTMRKRGQMAFNISFSLAVVAVSGFVWALFSEGFRGFMAGVIRGVLGGGGGE